MDSLESQVVITSSQTAETVAGSCNPTLEWVVLYFPQSGHFYKLFTNSGLIVDV